MRQLLRRAWYLIRRRRFEEDLREELEFHRAAIERELQENGIESTEARFAARRAIGGTALAQDQARDVWTPRALQGVGQDIRGAVRMLRSDRFVSVVAVVSLALAIGATTAMFGLLRALVFRPINVPDPYALVQIGTEFRPSVVGNLSFPAFRELERGQGAFTSLVGFTGVAVFSAEGPHGLTSALTMGVTANFYDEMGARPFAGRLFTRGDFTTEAVDSAVLGYRFWRDAFGSDPAAIGRTIRVDGLPLVVVGVAPPGFANLNVAAEPAITVALPMFPRLITQRMPLQPWTEDPNVTWVTTVGRLRPGMTIEQAGADVRALWPGILASLAPQIAGGDRRQNYLKTAVTVRSAATGWEPYNLRSRFTTPFYVVLGIAGLVLAIACVNVASLLLSRAAAREREIAVRVALGATRGRLARQLLCEGLLLSTMAAAGGVALAAWAGRAFPSLVFSNSLVPMAFDAAPDRAVLAFACALTILVGALFSLAPIWRALKYDSAATLQRQHRTVTQTGRVGRALVAAQIALCLMLVTVAGLLVRNLQEIRSIDIGVTTAGVTVAFPGPQPGAYQAADNDSYYPALLERVRSLPGVQAVGISQDKPLGGQPLQVNVGATQSEDGVTSVFTSASPGLFNVLGIPIVTGRDFTWADNSRSREVTIVSQSLARRLFGHANPIGRTIHAGAYKDEGDALQVVGVIADARAYDIKDPNLYIVYIPSLQRNAGANGKALVIRGAVNPHDLDRVVRPLGRESVGNVVRLDDILDTSLLRERLTSIVAGFFGLLALSLSAIGLFGLMSYSVMQRRREIGIRIALGGPIRRVTWQMFRAGLAVTVSGLVVGMTVAWMTTRFVASLLFSISPHDVPTMAVAPLLLLCVASVACWVPAWRAARIDPAVILRSE